MWKKQLWGFDNGRDTHTDTHHCHRWTCGARGMVVKRAN